MNETYLVARLTHNMNDWTRPSGPEHKSNNINPPRVAFEALYNFGFEEWMRTQKHQIDGYQYGYIQSLAEAHEGKQILLYTLKFNQNRTGPAERLLVGLVKKWEYVNLAASADAMANLPNCEQIMGADLAALPGMFNLQASLDQLHIHALHNDPQRPLFNVRYKKSDLAYGYGLGISTSELTKSTGFKIGRKKWEQIPPTIQQFIRENS